MPASGGVPAVRLGDGQPESPELAEPRDDLFGDVGILTMDSLGRRGDPLLGEPPEGVGHQLEIDVQMPGPGLAGQPGQPGRVAVGGDEMHPAPSSAPASAPHRASRPRTRVATSQTASAANAAASFASVGPWWPYLEGDPGRLEGGGAVGHVVGDHLVGVDCRRALAGEMCGGADRSPTGRGRRRRPASGSGAPGG